MINNSFFTLGLVASLQRLHLDALGKIRIGGARLDFHGPTGSSSRHPHYRFVAHRMPVAGSWGRHLIDIVAGIDETAAATLGALDTEPHPSPPLLELSGILQDQKGLPVLKNQEKTVLGVLLEWQFFDVIHQRMLFL